jgi:hypothetical protein
MKHKLFSFEPIVDKQTPFHYTFYGDTHVAVIFQCYSPVARSATFSVVLRKMSRTRHYPLFFDTLLDLAKGLLELEARMHLPHMVRGYKGER